MIRTQKYALCYFEPISLKYKLAGGIKKKVLLFKIAYNIDHLFKGAQNCHLTQGILYPDTRRYGDAFLFYSIFLQIKHNNTHCPRVLSFCAMAGNQLTFLECTVFRCSRFLFSILLQKGLFLTSYQGHINRVTNTTGGYFLLC